MATFIGKKPDLTETQENWVKAQYVKKPIDSTPEAGEKRVTKIVVDEDDNVIVKIEESA